VDLSAIPDGRVLEVERKPVLRAALAGPGRQAVANRTAGTADKFRRRLGVVVAAPRNLL